MTSLNHFCHYLTGTPFIILTDHGALIWLQNLSLQKANLLAAWLEKLQEYHFTIIYRLGCKYNNAFGQPKVQAPQVTPF